MKKYIVGILLGCGIVLVSYSQEGDNMSKYIKYIDSPILGYSIDKATQQLSTFDDSIDKGLVYFRVALLSNEEEKISKALEYWTMLYSKNGQKNPVELAYQGTLEAMYGGVVKGVTNKIKFAKEGMNKLSLAIEQIQESGDNLAIAYVYFLRGTTHSNMPTFLKEFKKETLNNLKNSVKYLKNSQKEHVYSDELYDALYTNLYNSYGRWYFKSKKYSTAIREYKKALGYIKGNSASNKALIEASLKEAEARR